MLIILDPCNLGFSRTPDGGSVIKIKDAGGILGDAELILPLGPEATKEIGAAMNDDGSGLIVAGAHEMPKGDEMSEAELKRRGL